MNDFSAIDGFLDTFIRYIDSGFGLVAGDVNSLAAILIMIDVTLAALFWAWGQNVDILQSLIKKTLYVGAFAYILGNFAILSNVVFQSFANLGLEASAAGFGAGDLMRPGLVAAEGMSASRPIFDQIGTLAPGLVEFFANFAEVALLFIAGLIVMAAFFVLSIQLFVLIVEFKLTTLAGFILVPFAFWRQTTFLAERVLGNVMASGVKVLVIAVIIGIGSTLFATIRSALPANDMTIEQAFSVVLGALTLMGLAVFCPRIAAGLVSGAPQLSAGAAVGTAVGTALAAGAATAGTMAAGGAAARGTAAATEAAATASGAVVTAARMGAMRTGFTGPGAAPVNAAVGLGAAAVGGIRDIGSRVASHFRARSDAGGRAVLEASGGASTGASASAEGATGSPDWVRKFRSAQAMREGALIAAHTIQSGDGGGASEGPDLKQKE
jgi:type IV secretion system protein TrbL